MVDVDWTIKFTDLLTVAGACFVGVTLLLNRNSSRAVEGKTIDGVVEELKGMKVELKELAKVITTLAVQDTRIANLASMVAMLQRNYEDMRRGVGWVTTPARDYMDGEHKG